jgi:hypothetical protein
VSPSARDLLDEESPDLLGEFDKLFPGKVCEIRG